MKLSFSSNAFRNHPLEEVVGILSGIGYEGLEVMCDIPHAWPPDMTPAKVKSLKAALKRAKMGVSNLNAFMMCAVEDFHHPSWVEPDPAYRRKRVDHTIAALKLAKKLGAKTVSTEPGGHLPYGYTREQALGLFREGLTEAAMHAEKLGVRLLIEPEPGMIVQSSGEFEDFIKTVDSSAVGLNFDLGHFFCVGEDPVALIRRLGRRIEHVHLEDIAEDREHFHLPPGRGAIDFRAVAAALKAIRYKGWITIELYPFQDDPASVAKQAFEAIRPLV
ncbi:MAG TPA: sugar phosphate isomerase/epimerase family protein [Planctomycetota bacterium]|nr:sugar phosphate isomerase/epimerase family protein [Planctomycetota bacterium]